MATRMDRQEVLLPALILHSARWRRWVALLVICTSLWCVIPARSVAQEQISPESAPEIDREDADEVLSPGEQGLLKHLTRLNQELSAEKRRALPPNGSGVREFAAQLTVRAWIHRELGNLTAAGDDVYEALQLVPNQPEALVLRARLAERRKAPIPKVELSAAAAPFTGDGSGPSSLLFSLRTVLGSLGSTWKKAPLLPLLFMGWGLLWLVLLSTGAQATRDVNGSHARLGIVAAILAAMCLCPILASFWWGLLDDPSPELWIVLGTGTFLSAIVLSTYLRPPIQLPDKHPLPLVDDPDVLARVDHLSNRVGISPPKVRLWRSATDNQLALAFAGCLAAPQVVITDGILNRLSAVEADAILAHELGHLANRSLWYYAPLIPLAGVAACLGSTWGLGVAWGVGLLVFVGLNRLVSRPLEFDCDRRAALAVNPQAMISALEKIHALLPIPNDGWLSDLFYASATHPPLVSRIARLQSLAGETLSSAEESQVRRIRCLGWLMFALWLGSLTWGGWQLQSSPQSIHVVVIVWCALATGPLLLTLVATYQLRRQAARRLQARRFSINPVHWIRKIGWALWLPAVAIFLIRLPDWLSHPASDMAAPLGICLLVVWMGTWLIQWLRKARLQHRINMLFIRGDYAAVVQEFDAAPARQQSNPALQNAAALALALSGQRQQAVERLESLTQSVPDFPAAWMSLAALQFDAGSHSLSEQSGARLTELLPLDPIGPFRQVIALLRMSKREAAREVLEAAKSRMPPTGLLEIADAAVAVEDGSPNAALPLLEAAERHLPGDCHLAILWIEWHLGRGNTAQAHTLLKELESRLKSNRLAFLDGAVRDLRSRLEACEKLTADATRSADTDL